MQAGMYKETTRTDQTRKACGISAGEVLCKIALESLQACHI